MRLRIMALVVLVALAASPARAGSLGFAGTGTVTSESIFGVLLGDAVTFDVSLDPSILATNPVSNDGYYVGTHATHLGLVFPAANITIDCVAVDDDVTDSGYAGGYYDQIWLIGVDCMDTGTQQIVDLSIVFRDGNGYTFSGAAQPVSIDLSAFTASHQIYVKYQGLTTSAHADVTSIERVPEPSYIGVAAVSTLGGVAARRRCRVKRPDSERI